MQSTLSKKEPVVGVGLRHPHFVDALSSSASVDFVEVHSENFFAKGGALPQLLSDIAEQYPVSLHSTAMGLGSAAGIPCNYLDQLVDLNRQIKPFLVSDHAAFAWGNLEGKAVHAGDLLPLTYNSENLDVMVRHVDQIQQALGRQILIENLSAYITLPGSTMSESQFLTRLTELTQCGLLIDLNNLLINLHNDSAANPVQEASDWIATIPKESVGEIHLAGFTQPDRGIAVDDHSQPVSEDCWKLYKYTLQKLGPVPTLIEWDNQLPDWQTLTQQATKAREIAQGVFNHA